MYRFIDIILNRYFNKLYRQGKICTILLRKPEHVLFACNRLRTAHICCGYDFSVLRRAIPPLPIANCSVAVSLYCGLTKYFASRWATDCYGSFLKSARRDFHEFDK